MDASKLEATAPHGPRAPPYPDPGRLNRIDDAALVQMAGLSVEACLARAGSQSAGLSTGEAQARLQSVGPNSVARERAPGWPRELWHHAGNPLNFLLAALAVISSVLGDTRAAIVIVIMITLAIVTAFFQEHRSNRAAARLRAMVKTSASVSRDGKTIDIALEDVVPGDVVHLRAGDMIPGDVRLLETKDLFINQSALTGESMPAEKFAGPCGVNAGDVADTGNADNADNANSANSANSADSAFDLPNLAFMGANLVSGFGSAVVLRTGDATYFGRLARKIAGERGPTAFDRGIQRYVWLMIRFIAVMALLVFVINGLGKQDWMQALFFAVAIAVGLTPEMLPMIITVNLARGGIAMAHAKVVVKRLQAIQEFGAMDVLCADKTGTLTQDRIILKHHLDIHGRESDKVLQYAWLNSHYQSGLRNLLDAAVLEHAELHEAMGAHQGYAEVDEIPFDFQRKRMSVVVSCPDGSRVLICKGAVEEVFAVCSRYESDGQVARLDASHAQSARAEMVALNNDGFRVVALACKQVSADQAVFSVADERELDLLGYIAFLDPPKESARAAIARLAEQGVRLKVLTGDNEHVTRKVCREVGLTAVTILTGPELEAMSELALGQAAETTTVFARLSPEQKQRIIGALQRNGHIVGFMGDGINDSAALKSADVGISVDNAVDIAKESADIILLEKNLQVLCEGVHEGRKVFANITKYIKMGASSNFGNMFSVLGASLFLPFLPMAPIQVLANNLLYDFSQTAIPSDHVDPEELKQPRRWNVGNVVKVMLVMGPVSSVFDYLCFGMLLFIFHAGAAPALFQSGWFVESLITQTLVIHILRTQKLPFVQSHASVPLAITSILVCVAAILLPHSWLAPALGLVALPWLYWPLVAGLLLGYVVCAHLVWRQCVRKWGI